MNASARKALGAIALLVYLAVYVVLAVAVASAVTQAHPLLQVVYFAVAGVIWVFPLRPLFRWMNALDGPRD